MSLQTTTWQTVGPFFSIGLNHLNTVEIAPTGTPGQRLTVEGCVIDGNGEPVPDAVIEIWQADAEGQFVVSADAVLEPTLSVFTGFGRVPTEDDGLFRFTTVPLTLSSAFRTPSGKTSSPGDPADTTLSRYSVALP